MKLKFTLRYLAWQLCQALADALKPSSNAPADAAPDQAPPSP